jgi:porin
MHRLRLPFLSSSALAALLIGMSPLHGGDGKAVAPEDDPFADRLLGDWGGARTSLQEHGLSVDLEGVYTFQGVANGGAKRLGSDYGNVFSGRLNVVLDTGKAGLWQGGFLTVRVEGRGGESVLARAATTSPVNNDALLPLIPGTINDEAWGLTELTYVQFFSKKFAIMGGLINTDGGDANPIAGFLGSNDYFMNAGMSYSTVIAGSAPNASLGGGFVYLASEANEFKVVAMGTAETVGSNPFEDYDGTTFLVEWDTKYKLGELPGGMTFSATYSVNQDRSNLTEDPRVLIADFLAGEELTTDKDAWTIMWNGYQYLSGDEKHGWGLFGRFGVSDGNPSLIRWSAAGGIGGVGLIPGREKDRWGLGVFHQDFTHEGLIGRTRLDGETGGELFYNIAFPRGLNLTLDAQVVDSGLPDIDTVVVLGARVCVRF